MIWIDIIVTLILIFSFIGGLRAGAMRSLFSLIALFIAIPVAGLFYQYIADLLDFIHNSIWQNFLGFFITFVIISIILAIIFFIPGRMLGGIFDKGLLSPLLGGVFSVIATCVSLVLFRIVVDTYPIFDWLDYVLASSSIINWLALYLDFIRLMLPEAFRNGTATVFLFNSINPILR